MRRGLTAFSFAVLGLLAGDARAADGSATQVIGFSPDARYFAFEQYFEQDGSGARTAEIVVIDVAADRFVPGTPIRLAWNPEAEGHDPKAPERSLADIRHAAAAQAAPLLAKLKLGGSASAIAFAPLSRPRDLLPPIEVNAVRGAAVRELPLAASPLDDARVALREIGFNLPRCENLVRAGRPKGFALVLERSGKAPLPLAADKTVPASRGCPSHYGISEVYVAPAGDGRIAIAVLIQYFYLAFEGDDRRFLAVTALVPKAGP